MKKILVTGGAGFIGSHLAQRLISRGDTLTIVDNLNDFYDPAIKKANLEEIGRTGSRSGPPRETAPWNISYVDIIHPADQNVQIYFEFRLDGSPETVIADLRNVANVREVESAPPFARIYGKRIIVMGGGAQVGQVALGAISEADRHNIRGERISVDTIPLVGEKELAAAVRALVRLPRVRLLVLAGSLMGGGDYARR